VPGERPPGALGHALKAVARAIGLPQSEPQPMSEAARIQSAALVLGSRISFGNEARSNVLRLSVQTESGELSARIANELARHFLDFKRHQKFAATQRAHEWFQERLGELAVKVRSAEQAVQAFREANGLTEVPTLRSGAPAYATINAQQMVET